MALDKSILKTKLESWMNSPYDVLNDAANAFADAYDLYCQDAIDPASNALLLANKQAVIDAFNTITNNDTASTAAVKIEGGMILYWTGATFDFQSPQLSSVVTVSILPSTISPTLTTIFSDISSSTTVSTKATQISDLFDTVTKTVIVTITLPSPTSPIIGPIS
ncbi:MAG: hypothetical protein GY853_09790 [PVC group bacterium]|nr:hypothetical protein [PVC group bacterium]